MVLVVKCFFDFGKKIVFRITVEKKRERSILLWTEKIVIFTLIYGKDKKENK